MVDLEAVFTITLQNKEWPYNHFSLLKKTKWPHNLKRLFMIQAYTHRILFVIALFSSMQQHVHASQPAPAPANPIININTGNGLSWKWTIGALAGVGIFSAYQGYKYAANNAQAKEQQSEKLLAEKQRAIDLHATTLADKEKMITGLTVRNTALESKITEHRLKSLSDQQEQTSVATLRKELGEATKEKTRLVHENTELAAHLKTVTEIPTLWTLLTSQHIFRKATEQSLSTYIHQQEALTEELSPNIQVTIANRFTKDFISYIQPAPKAKSFKAFAGQSFTLSSFLPPMSSKTK